MRGGRHSVLEPIGYLDFMGLVNGAAGGSPTGRHPGGDAFLGVPCFTLRDNTERPATVELGTNTLLGLATERIAEIPARLGG